MGKDLRQDDKIWAAMVGTIENALALSSYFPFELCVPASAPTPPCLRPLLYRT